MCRFLLPYEREMRSSEEEDEEAVAEVTLDETSGNLINGDQPDDDDIKVEEIVEVTKKDDDVQVVKEKKSFLGLKPLQFLTDPGIVQKQEEEDNKLKIDDLVIIPNTMNQLEEGGSALQNLAKIASRYSSLNKDKTRAAEFASPSPKKARVEEKPGVAQPLPPTSSKKGSASLSPFLAGGAMDPKGAATASALLQQFSLLSPGLFGAWPPTTTAAGATSTSNASPSSSKSASSWLSSFNLDPNVIGAEGYQLLKYYEQQWKALQQGATPSPSTTSKVGYWHQHLFVYFFFSMHFYLFY